MKDKIAETFTKPAILEAGIPAAARLPTPKEHASNRAEKDKFDKDVVNARVEAEELMENGFVATRRWSDEYLEIYQRLSFVLLGNLIETISASP